MSSPVNNSQPNLGAFNKALKNLDEHVSNMANYNARDRLVIDLKKVASESSLLSDDLPMLADQYPNDTQDLVLAVHACAKDIITKQGNDLSGLANRIIQMADKKRHDFYRWHQLDVLLEIKWIEGFKTVDVNQLIDWIKKEANIRNSGGRFEDLQIGMRAKSIESRIDDKEAAEYKQGINLAYSRLTGDEVDDDDIITLEEVLEIVKEGYDLPAKDDQFIFHLESNASMLRGRELIIENRKLPEAIQKQFHEKFKLREGVQYGGFISKVKKGENITKIYLENTHRDMVKVEHLSNNNYSFTILRKVTAGLWEFIQDNHKTLRKESNVIFGCVIPRSDLGEIVPLGPVSISSENTGLKSKLNTLSQLPAKPEFTVKIEPIKGVHSVFLVGNSKAEHAKNDIVSFESGGIKQHLFSGDDLNKFFQFEAYQKEYRFELRRSNVNECISISQPLNDAALRWHVQLRMDGIKDDVRKALRDEPLYLNRLLRNYSIDKKISSDAVEKYSDQINAIIRLQSEIKADEGSAEGIITELVLDAHLESNMAYGEGEVDVHELRLFQGIDARLPSVADKEVVVFVGPSGAGKSALIAQLLGEKLIAKLNSRGNNVVALNENNEAMKVKSPKIGHSPYLSETIYADGYAATFKINKVEKEITLVDTGGLGETRGEAYEACTTYSMMKAIEAADRVSAVAIVIPWVALDSSTRGISLFEKMVEDLSLLISKPLERPNFLMVITKHSQTINSLATHIRQMAAKENSTEHIWASLERMLGDKRIMLAPANNAKLDQILPNRKIRRDFINCLDACKSDPIEKDLFFGNIKNLSIEKSFMASMLGATRLLCDNVFLPFYEDIDKKIKSNNDTLNDFSNRDTALDEQLKEYKKNQKAEDIYRERFAVIDEDGPIPKDLITDRINHYKKLISSIYATLESLDKGYHSKIQKEIELKSDREQYLRKEKNAKQIIEKHDHEGQVPVTLQSMQAKPDAYVDDCFASRSLRNNLKKKYRNKQIRVREFPPGGKKESVTETLEIYWPKHPIAPKKWHHQAWFWLTGSANNYSLQCTPSNDANKEVSLNVKSVSGTNKLTVEITTKWFGSAGKIPNYNLVVQLPSQIALGPEITSAKIERYKSREEVKKIDQQLKLSKALFPAPPQPLMQMLKSGTSKKHVKKALEDSLNTTLTAYKERRDSLQNVLDNVKADWWVVIRQETEFMQKQQEDPQSEYNEKDVKGCKDFFLTVIESNKKELEKLNEKKLDLAILIYYRKELMNTIINFAKMLMKTQAHNDQNDVTVKACRELIEYIDDKCKGIEQLISRAEELINERIK